MPSPRRLVAPFVLLVFLPCSLAGQELGPGPGDMSNIRIRTWKEAGAEWSTLSEALSKHDLADAQRLVAAGVELDDRIATAIHFAYGTPAVRAFIRRSGPEEITRGELSFLAHLMSQTTSQPSHSGDFGDFYPSPTATSYLEDPTDVPVTHLTEARRARTLGCHACRRAGPRKPGGSRGVCTNLTEGAAQ